MQASLGRLSFTADMWSSAGMHPYLAITVHWLARREDNTVVLQQALLVFRRVCGAHSGTRLARIVVNIFESAGIVSKARFSLSLSLLCSDSFPTGWLFYHGQRVCERNDA